MSIHPLDILDSLFAIQHSPLTPHQSPITLAAPMSSDVADSMMQVTTPPHEIIGSLTYEKVGYPGLFSFLVRRWPCRSKQPTLHYPYSGGENLPIDPKDRRTK